jgi:sterol desaturase/sphingolipid hydroxylase (fatty acid hydroxylase superfamily)
LLEGRSGDDVTQLFDGSAPGGHAHSRAAASLLRKFHVGDLAGAERPAPTPPTPPHAAAPVAPAIDESQPLLRQVGSLGSDYMAWVHAPVPGRPRFFASAWAEAATKVRWWVVPLLWLPLVAHSLWRAGTGPDALRPAALAAFAAAGALTWQAIEYGLHRFLSHRPPARPRAIFLHFLLHGCHHKFPMDTDRLVFPPLPASLIVALVFAGVRAALPRAPAAAAFGGIMAGYVAYDCMHYAMHAGALGGPLAAAHMRHHYREPGAGFGISSPLLDWALGTRGGGGGGAGGRRRRRAAAVAAR